MRSLPRNLAPSRSRRSTTPRLLPLRPSSSGSALSVLPLRTRRNSRMNICKIQALALCLCLPPRLHLYNLARPRRWRWNSVSILIRSIGLSSSNTASPPCSCGRLSGAGACRRDGWRGDWSIRGIRVDWRQTLHRRGIAVAVCYRSRRKSEWSVYLASETIDPLSGKNLGGRGRRGERSGRHCMMMRHASCYDPREQTQFKGIEGRVVCVLLLQVWVTLLRESEREGWTSCLSNASWTSRARVRKQESHQWNRANSKRTRQHCCR